MIWAKKRFKILERDGFRCQYCGKKSSDVSLEIDHIIPKSKWWTDDFDNLITCCRECNMWKWNQIIWENVEIRKMKKKDHENKMVKYIFELWNIEWLWTIDKNNITFMSWFIKSMYWEHYMNIIMNEIIWQEKGFHWKYLTINDLYEWWENCELILSEADTVILEGDLLDLVFDTQNDSLWTTDDINKRLNYIISAKIVRLWFSKSFNLKYTLFPKLVEQWMIEWTAEY